VTTLVTVGYGDIHAYSTIEQYVCIILMILGVLVFSFTTGSLSSLITSYDSREAILKEKISVLNTISNEYGIDLLTFNKLVKTIKYDHSKKQKDVIKFMEELPHKLKLELSLVMIHKMYSNVRFFEDKDKSFLAWVARLIKPQNAEDNDYIYKEGEEIAEIFFINKGTAACVLPRFFNKPYINFQQGDHFGESDLGQDKLFLESIKNEKKVVFFDKEQLIRRFTVMA
jgi:Ion channel